MSWVFPALCPWVELGEELQKVRGRCVWRGTVPALCRCEASGREAVVGWLLAEVR